MESAEIIRKLSEAGLKITPQRIAVYDAVASLMNHPTAEQVIDSVKSDHPNIASGTVYKTLETLVEKGLIQKVKTDRDFMRYDAVTDVHYHLYCSKSERIEDFMDPELHQVIASYFNRHEIPNFKIEDIKLQIIGEFTEETKNIKQG